MAWDEVEAFILKRKAELLADAVGVPEEDLVAFETGTGHELPKAYRACMLKLGGSRGELQPLGPVWTHEFHALVTAPPPSEFLSNGLLRVGLHRDPSVVVAQDIYLDLETSEANDGWLLDVENHLDYEPDAMIPRGMTFLDQVVRRTFRVCEFDDRPEELGLIARLQEDERDEFVARSVELLNRLGLETCLPSSSRLVAMSGEGVSALLQARTVSKFVSLELAAEVRQDTARIAEVLLDNLPGLRRKRERQRLPVDGA